MNLSQTTKELLKKIELAEKDGRYNDHLDDMVFPEYYPIDENYSYDKKWYLRIAYFFIRLFIVKPYCFVVNHFWLRVKVTGRRNLKKIRKTGAIITCNHVNKLDAVALGKALHKRNCHYTVAEFNNMKCRLGTYMRAYGIMPIPLSRTGLRSFNSHLEKYLKKKHWVTFFPERSEWWCYEKPRPLQIGAFHYAASFEVPIVPVFITFIVTNKLDSEGIRKRKFVVNIGNPIYPDLSLPLKERKEVMRSLNEENNKRIYENFYKRELTY